jgi:hypothetical protein
MFLAVAIPINGVLFSPQRYKKGLSVDILMYRVNSPVAENFLVMSNLMYWSLKQKALYNRNALKFWNFG